MLVAREDFFECKKLCHRWRGLHRVVKALSNYLFRVEDLCNGNFKEVHGLRLKFNRDSDLDQKVVMFHILSSETSLPVARLLRLVNEGCELYVPLC